MSELNKVDERVLGILYDEASGMFHHRPSPEVKTALDYLRAALLERDALRAEVERMRLSWLNDATPAAKEKP